MRDSSTPTPTSTTGDTAPHEAEGGFWDDLLALVYLALEFGFTWVIAEAGLGLLSVVLHTPFDPANPWPGVVIGGGIMWLSRRHEARRAAKRALRDQGTRR